jgi:hypothetical protein
MLPLNFDRKERGMKNICFALFLLVCLVMVGCQPAVVTSVKWDSGLAGDKAQTRCERVDMRSQSEMDAVFKKFDGWKVIYISEYTTGNKVGTDGVVCFERMK